MSVDEQYLQTVMRTLSHDLGGAVRAASGFSELLLGQYGDQLDEKAIRWLNLTKQEGEKAQAYLNDFSRYARLYGVDDDWGECDLSDICHKIINHPAYVDSVGVHSPFTVDVANLPVVNGCGYLWKQYLEELILNSAKYSRLNDAPVICKIYSDQVGEMTRLIVEDNGVGMSPENLAKALMPFRQVAVSSVKDSASPYSPEGLGERKGQERQGLGIGLSLAKRIVEVHHGWFSVESQQGDNSFFRVIATLPK